MIKRDQLKQEYDHKLSKLEQTEREIKYIIDSFLQNTSIKIHSIQSRIKKFDSLLKKAETLGLSKEIEIFDVINDVVGLRIICLFISNISEIGELIKTNFNVIEEDNKLDGSEISSFGYFSTHFICKLNDDYKGPRYNNIKDVLFEIQIRTISMDAWANISHYLDYKSDTEIPKDLKKDFFALSGLFYVADTHFQLFYKSKREHSRAAHEDLEQKVDIEINFETLSAYLDQRFKNIEKAGPSSISLLIQELDLSGYKTIKQLDKKINDAVKTFPEKSIDANDNAVGIVKSLLMKVDSTYKDAFLKLLRQRIASLNKKKSKGIASKKNSTKK